MNKNFLTLGIVAVALTGVGFIGGISYQKSKPVAFNGTNRGQFAQSGNRGAGPNNRAGGQTIGEIISTDSKSITVKLADGSSKIILLGENTTIVKSTQASVTDLVSGVRVGIFGQSNPDGSLTAQNIQLNPMMRVVSTSPTPTK